eukprot:UN26636
MDDRVLISDLSKMTGTFEETLQKALMSIQENMSDHIDEMQKEEEVIKTELLKITELLQGGLFVDKNTQPEIAVVALDDIKIQLEVCEKNISTLKSYQALFQSPTNEFKNFKRTKMQYDKAYKFWNMYNHFDADAELWLKSNFKTLKIDECSIKITNYYKEAYLAFEREKLTSSRALTKL